MGRTKAVVSHVHNSVHQSASASTLPPTVKHKEADTRIFIHLIDMVTNRITKIGIRTADTDMLVLALASFTKLDAIGLQDQWMLFRTDKNYRNIPVHRIVSEIGIEMCSALPGFQRLPPTTKPNFTFMEHSGHLGKWPLLITIFDFSHFKPHNISYCGQKHINQQQNCENWLL